MSGWKRYHGKDVAKITRKATREAIRKSGYVILEAAKQQVPHDEGTLERSGIVLMAPDQTAQCLISFGGGEGTGHPQLPYAARWHEEDANFQKGRKRFYLIDPYKALAKKTVRKALEEEIKKALR